MKLCVFVVILSFAFFGSCTAASRDSIFQGQTWCVVKPGANQSQLQQFLDSACNQVDCSAVNPGGSCYEPNTLENHASYVLNLVYRQSGTCNPDLGLPSVNDPSFGNCRYT